MGVNPGMLCGIDSMPAFAPAAAGAARSSSVAQ
jgi:hypothetical protein